MSGSVASCNQKHMHTTVSSFSHLILFLKSKSHYPFSFFPSHEQLFSFLSLKLRDGNGIWDQKNDRLSPAGEITLLIHSFCLCRLQPSFSCIFWLIITFRLISKASLYVINSCAQTNTLSQAVKKRLFCAKSAVIRWKSAIEPEMACTTSQCSNCLTSSLFWRRDNNILTFVVQIIRIFFASWHSLVLTVSDKSFWRMCFGRKKATFVRHLKNADSTMWSFRKHNSFANNSMRHFCRGMSMHLFC